jgi:predicted nucleic acid-binding protein
LGIDAVRQLFDDLLAPFDLLWIDERIHESATAAMIAVESPRISFVDWTSFEVMRQHGIDRAFAFDDDFVKQGFQLVP